MNERREPFNMSLRMWSDDVYLKPIIASAGFSSPEHLHVKGQPSSQNGLLAKRMAPRHYATVATSTGATEQDIELWLSSTLDQAASLANPIRDGDLEAILWISVLGPVPRETPVFALKLIEKASMLGLGMMVENYTRPYESDPFPEKTWLTCGAI